MLNPSYTETAPTTSPVEPQSPAVLKLRWEAAKRLFDQALAAWERDEIPWATLDAVDQAECAAYAAWRAVA